MSTPTDSAHESKTTTLLHAVPEALPSGAPVMTTLVEHPPGSSGLPPHRHSGPVFGYVTDGAMLFELEGEPPRVISAGEAFWEPGGDVVHWQDANTSREAWLRFVVVMVCPTDQEMIVFLTEDEIEARQSLRSKKTASGSLASSND